MKCKNTPQKSYRGDENTPLGRGYSASVEEIGTKKKGLDGQYYIVVKWGKGKRWSLVSSSRKMRNQRLDFDEKQRRVMLGLMNVSDEYAYLAATDFNEQQYKNMLIFLRGGVSGKYAYFAARDFTERKCEVMLGLIRNGESIEDAYVLVRDYDLETVEDILRRYNTMRRKRI